MYLPFLHEEVINMQVIIRRTGAVYVFNNVKSFRDALEKYTQMYKNWCILCCRYVRVTFKISREDGRKAYLYCSHCGYNIDTVSLEKGD